MDTSGDAETMKISYAPNGNILFKTGVGNFSYDKNVRPHAVTEVENTDGKIPENGVTREFYYLISHHKFIGSSDKVRGIPTQIYQRYMIDFP